VAIRPNKSVAINVLVCIGSVPFTDATAPFIIDGAAAATKGYVAKPKKVAAAAGVKTVKSGSDANGTVASPIKPKRTAARHSVTSPKLLTKTQQLRVYFVLVELDKNGRGKMTPDGFQSSEINARARAKFIYFNENPWGLSQEDLKNPDVDIHGLMSLRPKSFDFGVIGVYIVSFALMSAREMKGKFVFVSK
jgi:hypothetical protein